MVRLRQLLEGEPADDDPAGRRAQGEIRGARQQRITLDASGKRATGVVYVGSSGEEWEQPDDLVILSAYTLFNVQLLLLSGIGKSYDPDKNEGVIGRNFTHQSVSTVNGFFDPKKFVFNPFIASGAIGIHS
jgi:gluconate 2-dehydrogenase alpha chain